MKRGEKIKFVDYEFRTNPIKIGGNWFSLCSSCDYKTDNSDGTLAVEGFWDEYKIKNENTM